MNQARRTLVVLAVCACAAPWITSDVSARQQGARRVGKSMGSFSKSSHAKTRSISPENVTGEKGNLGSEGAPGVR